MNSRASRGWPLLGHLPAFRADSTAFLLKISRQQGDVARFRLGRREAFLLSHPDQVRSVLVTHALAFSKGGLMQRARRLLGDGLLTSENDLHSAQRHRIQPAFTQECIHSYASLVPPLAERRAARWQSGAPVRIDKEMDALTMSIVARALLGANIEDDVPLLGRALSRLARWAPLLATPGAQLLDRTHLPVLRRLSDAIELIETVIERLIAQGGAGAPLLRTLLPAPGHSPPIPARLVRDEVMTLFLAGHDTTAAALSWIWLLLGTHPEVEARLRDEVMTVLGGDESIAANAAHFPYADLVVRETLRLYPPISRIGRRALRDVDIGRLVLPRGSAVFVSPFVTHRDPRWYVDPDAFRPMRWANPTVQQPRFTWFPFGAGPRSCIGQYFAQEVLVLVLATIARRWRLVPTGPNLPSPRSLLTLKPRGTVVMLAERLQ